MPNVRTHDFITYASAAVMVPASLNSGMPGLDVTNTAVLVGSYLFSGIMFSPDLDTASRPYRRWGPLRWIWLPYRGLVPHRSWVSHSVVLGPIVRVLYFIAALAFLFGLGVFIANLFMPIDPSGTLRLIGADLVNWVMRHPLPITYAIIGLVLGGAAHTIADIVFTGVKRRF
jgi:uncharacterized metal-binding protein